MKKIGLMLVMFLFFAGVVSASSVNGDYNGNPIVKVIVNGQEVESEVPAQMIDGSTLLPLRSISESLNSDVNWDQDTYTVSIDSKRSINELKMIMKIANHYQKLITLGDVINGLNQCFALADYSVKINKWNEQSQTCYNQLNDAINLYNSYININTNTINDASKYHFDITNTKTMLSDYNKGIDFYKKAFTSLNNNISFPNSNDYLDYLTNSQTAFKLVLSTQQDAIKNYNNFYFMTQTYNN